MELLPVAQYARRVGISARRVRALAGAGRIPGAIKLGRDWLIPASAIAIAGLRGPRGQASGALPSVSLAAPGELAAMKHARQIAFRTANSGPSARQASLDGTFLRLPPTGFTLTEPELDDEPLP
jgi:hypothetical protein